MHASIYSSDGLIKAEARDFTDQRGGVILIFSQSHGQGVSDLFSLALPARMSAAASMIAEAFNAHMQDDPATLHAQGSGDVITLVSPSRVMGDGITIIRFDDPPSGSVTIHAGPGGGGSSGKERVSDDAAVRAVEGERQPEPPAI